MPTAGQVELLIKALGRDQATAVLRQTSTELAGLRGKMQKAGTQAQGMSAGAQQARGGLERLRGTLGAVGDRVSGVVERLGGMRAAMGALAGGAAVAGLAHLAEQGAVLQAQLARLDTTAGAAEARFRALSEASGGVFAVEDLARFEGKQRELGVQLNLRARDLEALDARFTALGRDGGQALQQVAEALASGRTAQLKMLGLVEDTKAAYERQAQALGTTVSALSEVERRAAVIAEVQRNLAKINLESGSSVTAHERTAAAIANTWTQIKLALAPVGAVMQPLARLLADVARMARAVLGPAVIVLSGALGGLLGVVGSVVSGILRLINLALAPFAMALEGLMRLVGADGVAGQLRDLRTATQDVTGAHLEAAPAVQAHTKALLALQAAATGTGTTLQGLRSARAAVLTQQVGSLRAQVQALEARRRSTGSLTEAQEAQLRADKETIAVLQQQQGQEKLRAEAQKARMAINDAQGLSEQDRTTALELLRDAERAHSVAVQEAGFWQERQARAVDSSTRATRGATSASKAYAEAQRVEADAARGAVQVLRERQAAAATLRQETLSRAARVNDMRAELEILRARTPLQRAELEHQRELARIQAELAQGSVSRTEATLALNIAQEQHNRQLGELKDTAQERPYQQLAAGMAATQQQLQALNPTMGEMMGVFRTAVGHLDAFQAGEEGVAQAAIGTAQAVGVQVAQQVGGQRAVAAVMAAMEAARSVAAYARLDFFAGTLHAASAGMFGAIALTGGGGGSRPSRGGGGGGSAGSDRLVGGGQAGGGGQGGGGQTVIVQLGDGVMFGRAQDVGRAAAEAGDSMRKTGRTAVRR